MIAAALIVALVVLAVTVVVLAGVLRWLIRAQDRERHGWTVERLRLIDQVCHLSGKTWTQPPRTLASPRDTDEENFLIDDVDQVADEDLT